jgi:hypothetical protein
MMEWAIPGLYILVYMEKRAENFDLVYHIDMQRPFVVCPPLNGKKWQYLRRRIRGVQSQGVKQLFDLIMDQYQVQGELISTALIKPQSMIRPDLSSLVEVMSAYSFLPKEDTKLSDSVSLARQQLERVGFDPHSFFADFLRVDFGTAGLHQYCLFGGTNRFVLDGLKQEKASHQFAEDLRHNMDTNWHEKLASYLSVIMWSKIKVSPVLRAALIDDSVQVYSPKLRRDIESGFQNLVMRALMAYARSPL